ncbi:hypothetical protein F4861DRAFT_502905 [Xylaria intraflava]|nr:hypothetical protein F4861DRAFT_502905 [Xylaria intraflava]
MVALIPRNSSPRGLWLTSFVLDVMNSCLAATRSVLCIIMVSVGAGIAGIEETRTGKVLQKFSVRGNSPVQDWCRG